MRRHPRHIAVRAGGEKFPQTRRRQWDSIGPNDASDIKACRAGGNDQLRFNGGEI
jgi:hypothetical protein